jgi:hypothetical protein
MEGKRFGKQTKLPENLIRKIGREMDVGGDCKLRWGDVVYVLGRHEEYVEIITTYPNEAPSVYYGNSEACGRYLMQKNKENKHERRRVRRDNNKGGCRSLRRLSAARPFDY